MFIVDYDVANIRMQLTPGPSPTGGPASLMRGYMHPTLSSARAVAITLSHEKVVSSCRGYPQGSCIGLTTRFEELLVYFP